MTEISSTAGRWLSLEGGSGPCSRESLGAGLQALSPWVLLAMFNRVGLRRLHKGAEMTGTNGHTLFGLK